jgi:segregation and condensation protein A
VGIRMLEALEQPTPQQPTDPGIELLVTLAKTGEIDPWDIDIVQVTDKYLHALDRMEVRSLEHSGKGLFYACVLLHMKAQILASSYLPPEVVPDFAEGDYGFDDGMDPEDNLDWAQVVATGDGVLLVPRGRPRSRPITLDDLIRALKKCDTAERSRRDAGLPPTADYFVNSTNQDDVAADIEVVRRLIIRFSRGKAVSFGKLVGEGISAGGLFLALLFMAAREEVSLTQKDFYQDLSIATRTTKNES